MNFEQYLKDLNERLLILNNQISELTDNIQELKKVIINLDKQNQRIQIVGLILTGVGVVDVLLRIFG